MKKDNKMDHGEVQESIDLSVEYEIHKADSALRTEGTIRKTVSLDWRRFSSGTGMSIEAVVDFQEKANALLQEVKELLSDGTFVKVCLTKSAYENVPEYETYDELGTHKNTLYPLQFECWTFEDNCLDCDPEEEGAGLYLRPDEQYTEAHWDMILYWGQDILKSLKEAHL